MAEEPVEKKKALRCEKRDTGGPPVGASRTGFLILPEMV